MVRHVPRRLIAIGEFDAFANGGMVGRAAIRRFSRRWGFSELSDPASFPLIMFLLTPQELVDKSFQIKKSFWTSSWH